MMDIRNLASDPVYVKMGELYREWNAKINVISRKDIENVFEHHIMHSLCIGYYLEAEKPSEYLEWVNGIRKDNGRQIRVLDVGCGGGFPGIPLASMFPKVQFTLCDSIGKKVGVAREVAASLGLDNVTCVHSRVEDLPGNWDYVVSRAVTSLDNFLPWVMGRFDRSILYLKGGDITPELTACWEKFGPRTPSAQTWGLSSILKDEYFAEKLVVNLVNSAK